MDDFEAFTPGVCLSEAILPANIVLTMEGHRFTSAKCCAFKGTTGCTKRGMYMCASGWCGYAAYCWKHSERQADEQGSMLRVCDMCLPTSKVTRLEMEHTTIEELEDDSASDVDSDGPDGMGVCFGCPWLMIPDAITYPTTRGQRFITARRCYHSDLSGCPHPGEYECGICRQAVCTSCSDILPADERDDDDLGRYRTCSDCATLEYGRRAAGVEDEVVIPHEPTAYDKQAAQRLRGTNMTYVKVREANAGETTEAIMDDVTGKVISEKRPFWFKPNSEGLVFDHAKGTRILANADGIVQIDELAMQNINDCKSCRKTIGRSRCVPILDTQSKRAWLCEKCFIQRPLAEVDTDRCRWAYEPRPPVYRTVVPWIRCPTCRFPNVWPEPGIMSRCTLCTALLRLRDFGEAKQRSQLTGKACSAEKVGLEREEEGTDVFREAEIKYQSQVMRETIPT